MSIYDERNITCPRCRFRHPPHMDCAEAKRLADESCAERAVVEQQFAEAEARVVAQEALELPTVPLPTLSLRFSGETARPAASAWIGRPQVHSDEDGETYLVFPCRGVEASVGLGDCGAEELEFLIAQLQARLDETKEVGS